MKHGANLQAVVYIYCIRFSCIRPGTIVSSDSEFDSSDSSSNTETQSNERDEQGTSVESGATASIPLYPGATVTEEEGFVSILSIAHQRRLTYACLADMLQLLSRLLPKPNSLCLTAQRLINKYVRYDRESITHRCCGYCLSRLHGETKCTNEEYKGADLPDSIFVELPLDDQLKERLAGKDLCILLSLKVRF